MKHIVICSGCKGKVYPNKRRFDHLCAWCGEKAHDLARKQFRLDQLNDKNSEIRKWYKWICKHDLYEPSVKVKGEINSTELHYLLPRLVYENVEAIQKRVEVIKSGPLKGMEYETSWVIDGYARLRTDNNFYWPECGKAGIPHEYLSGASKDFQRHVNKVAATERERKSEAEHKKWVENQKAKWLSESHLRNSIIHTRNQIDSYNRKEKARIARESTAARKQEYKERMHKKRESEARMRKAKKTSNIFFQMQVAAISISEYATTNKH